MKYETLRRIKRKGGKVRNVREPPGDNYRCPFDMLPCKRYSYALRAGACFTWDVNGRLRWVCRRYPRDMRLKIPKQLSPEDMKDDF
jgi:hypothetical protein